MIVVPAEVTSYCLAICFPVSLQRFTRTTSAFPSSSFSSPFTMGEVARHLPHVFLKKLNKTGWPFPTRPSRSEIELSFVALLRKNSHIAAMMPTAIRNGYLSNKNSVMGPLFWVRSSFDSRGYLKTSSIFGQVFPNVI